ncbi:MAG: hypothetical protein V9E90_01425 [Saprospiraceae bacterium]
MKNILAVIGAFALGWFALNKVFNHVASSIYVHSVGLRVGSFDLTGLNLTIPITVENRSNVSIPINSFRGNIFYGVQDIAPVFINNKITIAAKAMTVIQVETLIKIKDTAQNILDLIASNEYLNNLRLVGLLNYEGVELPIDQVIKII